ncbi:hypothetical protein BGZ49_001661 [Haplosporangium sp. Z 27]|nr:hypothetical protein BGZ49_001661 [Haplosporangium sp. Z 27]
MFVISWIRSSDAQAADASKAQSNEVPVIDDVNPTMEVVSAEAEVEEVSATIQDDKHQDDWVFLPSDHNDLMESSISDLDLLSASMTLYPARSTTVSTHPASSRTRDETIASSSSSSSSSGGVTDEPTTNNNNDNVKKSKRQLKQERRQKQALEEQERKPRYDPMIAKMRDHELKLAKMAKLSMRSERVISSNSGGIGPQASPMASRG